MSALPLDLNSIIFIQNRPADLTTATATIADTDPSNSAKLEPTIK
jgi:hypothetical protein